MSLKMVRVIYCSAQMESNQREGCLSVKGCSSWLYDVVFNMILRWNSWRDAQKLDDAISKEILISELLCHIFKIYPSHLSRCFTGFWLHLPFWFNQCWNWKKRISCHHFFSFPQVHSFGLCWPLNVCLCNVHSHVPCNLTQTHCMCTIWCCLRHQHALKCFFPWCCKWKGSRYEF